MAVDNKNIVRLDLEDIFEDAKERSFHVVQALDAQGAQGEDRSYHPDVYAISGNETRLLYRFVTAGASQLSNYASMVKHHTQTGIDALTQYQDMETPEDADSYTDPDANTANDEYITGPDNTTVYTSDIIGREHDTGEKLSKGIGDTILFSITDLDEDHYRYTVVQQFIRDALVEYALYEWFKLKGVGKQASIHFQTYEAIARKVRFNAVINHKRKDRRRNIGPVI